MDPELDGRLRAAAFAYLNRLAGGSGGLVTRRQLEAFQFEGQTVRLVAPRQGIWRPRFLDRALSILTTYSPDPARRPYEDVVGPDGYLRYKWRGTAPDHADNVGLRRAMTDRVPLIWLRGVGAGGYVAEYPIWIADEEPEQQQFVVAFDDVQLAGWNRDLAAQPFAPARRYAERVVRTRVHQDRFRGEVLVAYARACALCRLRHTQILDAAHIRRDAQGGEPIVPNGIAMCALHHRAFDANLLGIDPRHRIEIRDDVLGEPDGPTLTYALQGLHGEVLSLPRRRAEQPRADLLEERYEEFRAAG
jgi:putative restriction endonuclease